MHKDRNIRRPPPIAAPLAAAVAALFVTGAFAQGATYTVSENGTKQETAGDRQPAGSGLRAVVVTATRSPAEALGVPASVTVVGEAELRERSVARFGDALADVPGVYVRGAALGQGYPGSGQAVLSMRGIPRTPRTLVMIDGQPVNNALTGGVNVGGIPLESLERVEVVRGPYSASPYPSLSR